MHRHSVIVHPVQPHYKHLSILHWRCLYCVSGGSWRGKYLSILHWRCVPIEVDEEALASMYNFQYSIGDACSSRGACCAADSGLSILHWRCRTRKKKKTSGVVVLVLSILHWRCNIDASPPNACAALALSILHWRCASLATSSSGAFGYSFNTPLEMLVYTSPQHGGARGALSILHWRC